jgi:phosphatidylinositol alpha-mannosyltransferase
MLSVSAAAQTYAKQSFGIDTIISPNVISIRDFHLRQPVVEKGKRIIFLGRLVERKGCLQLIKAFSLLHRSLPQARLIIAGDGPQRQKLEKYVNNQHLDHVVDFLGYVREEDKASLLASADIACFPSLYGESFGIVLIEAMAAGAEVVLGGDNAGYSTVLGERPKLLINPTETQMFAERLTELLTDEKLIEKLHQWQRSAVRQYDLDVVGPQIVEIYNRAIASRLKSRHN